MVIVKCSYCGYIGSSKGKYRSCCVEWDDVQKHELNCDQRPKDD